MKTDQIMDLSKMPTMSEKVIYLLPLTIGTMMYCTTNLMFINAALIDIQRRNIQMQLLS